MLQDIDNRLWIWASWCIRGKKIIGLGYPSQVPYMRLTPSKVIHDPSINESAWVIEKAVQSLKIKEKRLITQFYLHTGTIQSHAQALRISKTTLYDRIHLIHQKIARYLSENY